MVGVIVGVYLVSFHGWHDCVSECTWCCFVVGTNVCVYLVSFLCWRECVCECTWCNFYGWHKYVSTWYHFMVGMNV